MTAIIVCSSERRYSVRFIYTMSEQDKDKMISLGYVLMKEDKRNRMWVFQNKESETFSSEDELFKAGIRFALSNTLTF